MSRVAYLPTAFDPEPQRVCRGCGCTEEQACYRPDRGPCAWVEADLCSSCAPEQRERRRARNWRRAFFVLLAVVSLFWTACALDAWLEAQPAPPAPAPFRAAAVPNPFTWSTAARPGPLPLAA